MLRSKYKRYKVYLFEYGKVRYIKFCFYKWYAKKLSKNWVRSGFKRKTVIRKLK